MQLQQESLVSFQRKCEEKILTTNSCLITRTVTPQTIQQRLGKANLFIEETLIFLDESDGITSLSFSYNRSRALRCFQLPNPLSVFLEHPCTCVCRHIMPASFVFLSHLHFPSLHIDRASESSQATVANKNDQRKRGHSFFLAPLTWFILVSITGSTQPVGSVSWTFSFCFVLNRAGNSFQAVTFSFHWKGKTDS